MALVIGGECLLAYLWLPSADQVAAEVQRMAEEAGEQQAAESAAGSDEEVVEVEVDLGRFTITNHRLPTEATFRVDFQLFGIIAEKNESEFMKLFERNKYRFRDRVIVEMRNFDIDDLTDPELGLIKRRILEKSNTLLGRPLLRAVVFADYSFVEL
jgi:flagellar FliL protein